MNAAVTCTMTEAKAKLPELINRIIYNREKIYISRKGKNVAVLAPVEEETQDKEEGLILAQKGLADLGDEIDEMEDYIYKLRENEVSRDVNL